MIALWQVKNDILSILCRISPRPRRANPGPSATGEKRGSYGEEEGSVCSGC
ncbi:MAG: hypothetical protein PHC39_04670 [Proteiniphilum sp.]|nr:hypothetical protein [Proteiniphilum sp.]